MAKAYAEVQEKARQEAANPSKTEITIDPKKKKKESSGTETEVSTQESTKFLIPEEIPTQERTAFHGAAAAASKAGKSHFMFKGKKYPATMQKDTAHAITSDTQKESVQEAKVDEVSKGKLGSYIKKANINTADAADQNARGAKQIGKVMKRFKGVGQAVDKLTGKAKVPAKEQADDDTVRMYKDNPNMMKKGGPGGLKGLTKSAQRDVKKAVRKESFEIDEAATAQHKPDDKTRDTYEKQLSTRKGEKDFVDQHKVEMPKAADEPKIDALNFQTFKTMTKKSKSRPGDNAKGDTNIIPSATPVKGK